MAVMQLVVRDSDAASAGLAALPNPLQKSPESFDDASTHALLLGSNDLVEIGTQLCALGFKVKSVDLVDRYFVSTDDETSEGIGEALIGFMSRGDVDSARRFHESSLMDGIYVAQLKLRNTASGGVIALAQDGILMGDEANSRQVAQGLAEVMHLRLVE